MLRVFMILLTQHGGGPVGGAFAAQDSMAACEAKMPAIVHTIKASGTTVFRSACVKGDWPFSKFSHEGGNRHEDHVYLVDFSHGATPVVKPMAGNVACERLRRSNGNAAAIKRRYCVISRQRWER